MYIKIDGTNTENLPCLGSTFEKFTAKIKRTKIVNGIDMFHWVCDFEDLIEICLKKKDMKLKYELQNNVNLVSFSNMNIEISMNDKLNKNFIKDLSEKLYDWTKNRWLISFSKEKGAISEKEKKHNIKKKNITEYKSSNEYKNLLKVLPDIELTDIEKKDD